MRTSNFTVSFLASIFFLGISASNADTPIHRFQFAGEPSVSTYEWLEDRGFVLKQDLKDPDKVALSQSDAGLHLRVKEGAFGLILHEEDVPEAKHVRLKWGVSKYPDGASYERGIDNEAIMVYVFFGHEKFSSGSVFIPDSPYFIGFFLCEDGTDLLEKPYVGHHYAKTGRYVCVGHPETSKMVVTELDLVSEFKKSFGRDDVPVVSGISIEVDTTHSKNDGKAAASIESIEFLE